MAVVTDFERIADLYYCPLYRFVYSHTGHDTDPSDLTQQTFCIWARRGQDDSYQQIGKILEIPLGTVKSRMSPGIAQFQQLPAESDLKPARKAAL